MDKLKAKKKKDILNKFDPALVNAAVMELAGNMKKVDKKDVEKAKEQLKEIYKSIPKTKDGMQILATALDEFNSEIILEEIEKVKTELEDFSKAELIELAKDLGEKLEVECPARLITCRVCISGPICFRCVLTPICGPCLRFICGPCLRYPICGPCLGYNVCHVCQRLICYKCMSFVVNFPCPPALIYDCGGAVNFPDIPEIGDMMDNTVFTEQLVDALLKNPKLSRAMRKLIVDMKKNGEI